MKIDFDPVKNAKNIRKRGLGFIEQRLYALVFVKIVNGIRVISFRKANQREVKNYETQSRIN